MKTIHCSLMFAAASLSFALFGAGLTPADAQGHLVHPTKHPVSQKPGFGLGVSPNKIWGRTRTGTPTRRPSRVYTNVWSIDGGLSGGGSIEENGTSGQAEIFEAPVSGPRVPTKVSDAAPQHLKSALQALRSADQALCASPSPDLADALQFLKTADFELKALPTASDGHSRSAIDKTENAINRLSRKNHPGSGVMELTEQALSEVQAQVQMY